jgi:hypothetical protein
MNYHLVEVRFRPNDRLYSFKAPDTVQTGDNVFVKTWVNPEGVTVKVENTKPLDNLFNYSHAKKVDNEDQTV